MIFGFKSQHARELEIRRREQEEKERKKQKEVQMDLERQLKEAEMVGEVNFNYSLLKCEVCLSVSGIMKLSENRCWYSRKGCFGQICFEYLCVCVSS